MSSNEVKKQNENINKDSNINNNINNKNNEKISQKESDNDNKKEENKIGFSKIIGSYALFDQIGKGSFSKVTKAIHLITEQIVAVKILEKAKIEDEIDVERIGREIEILKTIMHPNIAQMYESFSTIHNIYLMLEYAEGGDLFDYITNKDHLSEIEACHFYRQLIGVLEYLTEMGITHRDIKPENILLDKKKENIKVIDFGLSNYCKGNELLESSCGSPCYASPEMLSGSPYKGVTTDLWSSGIVLYCMLVGSLPFDDQDLKVLYSQIKNGQFFVPSNLSMDAIDLLKKILEVNPKKRITIKQLKQHCWFNITQNIIYKSINYEQGKFPCDKTVIDYVIKNYFDNEDINNEKFIKMVKNHESNKYTATYFLVKKYILHKDDIIIDEIKKKHKLNFSNIKIILNNSSNDINRQKKQNNKNKFLSTRCKTEENINFSNNDNCTSNTNNKFNINTKIIFLTEKNNFNKNIKNNSSLMKNKETVLCKNKNISEINISRINNSNVKKDILKLELKDNKGNKNLSKPKYISTEPYNNNLKYFSKDKKSIRHELFNLEKNKKKNVLYIKNKNIKNPQSPTEVNIFRTKINISHSKYTNIVPKIDLSSYFNKNPNKLNIHVINSDNKNNNSVNYNMKNTKKNNFVENLQKKKISSADHKINDAHERNSSTSNSENQNLIHKTTNKNNKTATELPTKINKNNLNDISNYKKIIEKNNINKKINKLLPESIYNNNNLIINLNYPKKKLKIKKTAIDLLEFKVKNKKKKLILNTGDQTNENNCKSERINNNLGYYNNFNITNNLVLNNSFVNNFFFNKGNVINNNIDFNNVKNVRHFYVEKYNKGKI